MRNPNERNPAEPTAIVDGVFAPSPAEITAEDLRDLLDASEKHPVTVIDVRPAEDFNAVHIPGSTNRPLQEINFVKLVAELAPNGRPTTTALIFVSSQSPDLDDLAALEYINEYTKAYGHAPENGSVNILLGGVCNWLQQYPQ